MARFGVASFDEFYVTRIGMFTRLREYGVAVIAGVDSGMGPTKRHGNAWRTVAEQVDGGYSVPEALASATSLAAQACGLAAENGRLAAGYDADLLVVAGDLSRDVTLLSSPLDVLVRGTRVNSPNAFLQRTASCAQADPTRGPRSSARLSAAWSRGERAGSRSVVTRCARWLAAHRLPWWTISPGWGVDCRRRRPWRDWSTPCRCSGGRTSDLPGWPG